jgi:large subunit ribosomal protein L21
VRTDEMKMLTGNDLSKIKVTGKIVKHFRGPKVQVLKFKKTRQYKITRGHRQSYSAVKVGDIQVP